MGDHELIDRVLTEACGSGLVPGAVATVGDRHGQRYSGAFGWADPDRRTRLTAGSVFRLASMTKLITAVAVLQQVDRDLLQLDEPVIRYLPQFAKLQVLDGFEQERPRLRPVAGQATVRQLLSNTSGLSYEVWNQEILRFQQLTGTPAISSGRLGVLDTPLIADPGTVVEYGTGFDWGGQLVERVSGRSLQEYCRTEIFEPLQMKHTSLTQLPDASLLYPPVLAQSDAGFRMTDISYPSDADFATGGGCFYATAGDYLKLQRALLCDGEVDGVRLLSPASSEEILTAQTEVHAPVLRSALPWLSADVDLGPDWRWGFGLLVNGAASPGGRAALSGGWWGIFNTTFWIDRAAGLAANLMMQFVPFYCEAAVEIATRFERAVYASTWS